MLSEMDRDAIFEVVTADPTILRLGKNIFDERKCCKHQSAVRDASDGAIAAAGERGRDGRGPVGHLKLGWKMRSLRCVWRTGRQKGLKVTLDSLIKKAAKGFVTHLYVRLCQMNAA